MTETSPGDAKPSVEQIAAVDSELRAAGAERRGEVLARAGFSEETYAAAKDAVNARIQSALVRGDNRDVVAYAAAFRKSRVESASPVSSRASDAAPTSASAGGAPAPIQVPTYLAADRLVRRPEPPSEPAARPFVASEDPLDSTVEVGIKADTPRSLPFVRISDAAPMVVKLAAPGHAAAPPSPRDPLDRTSEVDSRLVTGDALPFLGVSAARGELTLEQYASLCSELATFGRERHESRARAYGLADDIALVKLHGRWRARFEVDAALHLKFTELRDTYSAWLRRR